MKKEMKVRLMTTLMAGTFIFSFLVVPPTLNPTSLGPVTVQAAEVSKETKSELTFQEARKIVLADAGLEDKDVSWYDTHKDFDDDTQTTTWDLGFFRGDTEYDYDVNVATGEIAEKDTGFMDAEDKAENQQKAAVLKAVLENESQKNKEDVRFITGEQALTIALKDAGVSADSAKIIKNHLDQDDGMEVYEVEFTKGDKKYEFDINAKTGAIHDKDVDSVYDD